MSEDKPESALMSLVGVLGVALKVDVLEEVGDNGRESGHSTRHADDAVCISNAAKHDLLRTFVSHLVSVVGRHLFWPSFKRLSFSLLGRCLLALVACVAVTKNQK